MSLNVLLMKIKVYYEPTNYTSFTISFKARNTILKEYIFNTRENFLKINQYNKTSNTCYS